ncbi:MAG: hypothetical protein PHR78_05275 [Eubacteriales bacterium]|nr:hypothetical protein [Eubacteriales bacterium]MDD4323738.1 hypothetical protein [Eubacteriales bacterium]MDD4541549.1 hypothetical protein [Eubacteriales bacterium]
MKTRGYLRHLLKQHRAIVILYFAVSIIIYPISLLLQSLSREEWQSIEYAPSPLAILMVILGAVTPFIIFSFIYDKTKMDTYFSLPMPRERLFLIHFAFNWLIQIIPVLISNFLAFLVVNFITPATLLTDVGPYSFSQFLIWSGILVLGSVMLQLPSIVAILSTTNLFNGFVYALVLHLVPITMQGVWSSSITDYFGYTPAQGFADASLIELEFHSIYVLSSSQQSKGEYLLALVIWFVVALALVALSTWLFKTHKVERTNTSYMVKGFYPTVIAIYGTLLLLIMLNNSFDEFYYYSDRPFFLNNIFIYIFLFGFVVLFIVEIIRYHGMPKIGRTILFYLAIFAVALGLSFFLNTVVERWQITELPPRDKVAKVELTSADYQYYEGEEHKSIFVYPFGLVTNYSQVTVADEAAIDEIMNIHEQIVEQWLAWDLSDRSFEPNAPYNNPHLRLVYLDSDGDQLLVRTYYVFSSKHRQDLEEISGIELILSGEGDKVR